MTREEAIKQLENLKEHCSEMATGGRIWLEDVEALQMAIESLKVDLAYDLAYEEAEKESEGE